MFAVAMFDPEVWAAVPFHFWSLVLFLFGTMVGSFLNVCIYRLPRGESVVSPPSHCPHCGYSIPWYLNLPLFTWLYLRARCANCRAHISARYFVVELITGLLFLFSWLRHGGFSPGLALVFCLLLAGFIVASCIDLEHFIIPDAITFGGMGAGFICSFLVPALHGRKSASDALVDSALGMVVGGGLVYAVVRGGKLLFGRQKIELKPGTLIVFTEDFVAFPEENVPYEDIFYRKSDCIRFHARRLELPDRCFQEVDVRLYPDCLKVEQQEFKPDDVGHMEAVIDDQITLPREAMGFGDVLFMAAIGAFLGWPGVIFALTGSSIIGAVVGVGLIVTGQQQWSSRLPYGPFIALAATIWVFYSDALVALLFGR